MGGRSTACWATSAGATEGWCLVVAKKQQRGGKAKAGGKGKAPAVDDALGPGGQALARLFHPTQVDAGWDDRGLVHERRPPAPLGRPTRGGESACAPRTSCRRIVCLGVHASACTLATCTGNGGLSSARVCSRVGEAQGVACSAAPRIGRDYYDPTFRSCGFGIGYEYMGLQVRDGAAATHLRCKPPRRGAASRRRRVDEARGTILRRRKRSRRDASARSQRRSSSCGRGAQSERLGGSAATRQLQRGAPRARSCAPGRRRAVRALGPPTEPIQSVFSAALVTGPQPRYSAEIAQHGMIGEREREATASCMSLSLEHFYRVHTFPARPAAHTSPGRDDRG